MAQHTAGPWAVHPSLARVDAFHESGPIPVCELLWPTDMRTEDETEANAALIAAAPDLLAACKKLMDVCAQEATTENTVPFDVALAIIGIKEVIAKAEQR